MWTLGRAKKIALTRVSKELAITLDRNIVSPVGSPVWKPCRGVDPERMSIALTISYAHWLEAQGARRTEDQERREQQQLRALKLFESKRKKAWNRKPNAKRLIKDVTAAGLDVKTVKTAPDGSVTVEVGKAPHAEDITPLEAWKAKRNVR
jgi:hypothetical protein